MEQKPEWAEEARERWGETDAYRESARHWKGYGGDDVARMKEELEAIESDFAEALVQGVPATDPLARSIAERARLHISKWHYDCPPKMHGALAEMYVSDPRFRAHYDDRATGLAEYVKACIVANAG